MRFLSPTAFLGLSFGRFHVQDDGGGSRRAEFQFEDPPHDPVHGHADVDIFLGRCQEPLFNVVFFAEPTYHARVYYYPCRIQLET